MRAHTQIKSLSMFYLFFSIYGFSLFPKYNLSGKEKGTTFRMAHPALCPHSINTLVGFHKSPLPYRSTYPLPILAYGGGGFLRNTKPINPFKSSRIYTYAHIRKAETNQFQKDLYIYP